MTTLDRDNFMPRYLSLANTLRARGIPTEVYLEPKSIKKQISYASNNGIPYAVIAGETEFESDEVQLKNLAERSQQTVAISELAEFVLGEQAAAT